MLVFEAHIFVAAMGRLESLNDLAKSDSSWLYKDIVRRGYFIDALDTMINQLGVLELRLALKKVKDIKLFIESNAEDASKDANIISSVVNDKLKELKERIEQELEDKLIYVVPQGYADAELQLPAFVKGDIADKFPIILSDLFEASACLTFSRNTAVVFHLMRAMEACVKRIGEKLEVTVIDKHNKDLEWGKIIGNINDAIGKMQPGDQKERWSSIAAMLYHVKLAWRNSTMHPKSSYSDEDSKAIYSSSLYFIKHLSAFV